MITANEARKRTNLHKKTVGDLYDSIKVMADAGNDYATFTAKDVRDLEDCKKLLTENGFSIKHEGEYLTISW